MSMTKAQIDLVSAHISQIDSGGVFVYPILEVAGPKGPALQCLVNLLLARQIPRQWFAMIAVQYHLKAGGNLPSRAWCITQDCPVHGYLAYERDDAAVAEMFPDSEPTTSLDEVIKSAIFAANLSPEVNLRLALAEVFPTHLSDVRDEWVAYAKSLNFEGVTQADIDAAADTVFLSIGLGSVIKNIKDGCKGSSCPGVPKTIGKS